MTPLKSRTCTLIPFKEPRCALMPSGRNFMVARILCDNGRKVSNQLGKSIKKKVTGNKVAQFIYL